MYVKRFSFVFAQHSNQLLPTCPKVEVIGYGPLNEKKMGRHPVNAMDIPGGRDGDYLLSSAFFFAAQRFF